MNLKKGIKTLNNEKVMRKYHALTKTGLAISYKNRLSSSSASPSAREESINDLNPELLQAFAKSFEDDENEAVVVADVSDVELKPADGIWLQISSIDRKNAEYMKITLPQAETSKRPPYTKLERRIMFALHERYGNSRINWRNFEIEFHNLLKYNFLKNNEAEGYERTAAQLEAKLKRSKNKRKSQAEYITFKKNRKETHFINAATDTHAENVMIAQLRTQLIPDEQRSEINKYLLANDGQNNIIIMINNAEIYLSHFQTLNPGRWINDAIINAYLFMLKMEHPRYFYFNSLLWASYSKDGSASNGFRKLTEEAAKKEVIFVPVNPNCNHWALLVIYIQEKAIHFYDSCSNNGNSGYSREFLQHALKWISEFIDLSPDYQDSWECLTKDSPQQTNGYDCGVFTCINAYLLSNNIVLRKESYLQSDIPHFR